MPLFNNDKLLDAVTQRLVETKVAPSLSRADSDIFWKTMCDDLWRQLCGKTLSSTTMSVFKRKIGSEDPGHAIPRVRIGLGSFYLSSQPHVVQPDMPGVETISEAEAGNITYYSGGAGSAGPIGISISEDYLVRYGLKCRRQLAAKQLPDGTSAPSDISASRMYFEATNALTSHYGRTGGSLKDRGSSSRPPTSSSVNDVNNKLLAPGRPQSSQSIGSGNGSRIGPRPPTGSSKATARCILDDLPSLRQELCRKFIQCVVEVIGEAGRANNDVEIDISKIGLLTIKQKVMSLQLADSKQEASGDPAAGIPFASKLKPSEREETLIENDGTENVSLKDVNALRPPLLSNKARLRLQMRNSLVQMAADDVPPPINDMDSCFSSPSMNATRAALLAKTIADAKRTSETAGPETGLIKESPSRAVDAIRKLKITNKFDPKNADLDRTTTAAGAATSVRIGKSIGRPAGSSNGAIQDSTAISLAYLDSKLAALRGKLRDPLEELESNMYGDFPPPPPPPPATKPTKQRVAALPTVAAPKSSVSRAIQQPFPFSNNSESPLPPKNKTQSSNKELTIAEYNTQVTKNRRLHSLEEQDVSSMEALKNRRALKQQQQLAFGSALISQARQRDEKKINEAAEALLIQQKETEVQVLSEALEIIEKMKRKRERAREQGLGDY